MSAHAERHHAPLDGLRAIAVAAVLLSHYRPDVEAFAYAGPQGVRLFLVLSGFLITGILLRCRDAMEAADEGAQGFGFTLRQFYARRFLRIFPLYYATLAVMWVAAIGDVRETIGWHAAYLSNALFAVRGAWGDMTAHFWTLALEEQFYLVWPLIVLVVARRHLVPLLVGTVGISVAWRAATPLLGVPDMTKWMVPLFALDSLAVGCLLAVVGTPRTARRVGTAHGVASRPDAVAAHVRPRRAPRWLRVGVAVALVAWPAAYLVGSGRLVPPAAGQAVVQSVVGAAENLMTSLLFAGAVWYGASGARGPAARIFAWAPLAYLGRISYGIYVLHLLGGLAVTRVSAGLGRPLAAGGTGYAIAASALTIALAAASWHWFEAPINQQKRRFPYVKSRRTAPAAQPTLAPADT